MAIQSLIARNVSRHWGSLLISSLTFSDQNSFSSTTGHLDIKWNLWPVCFESSCMQMFPFEGTDKSFRLMILAIKLNDIF